MSIDQKKVLITGANRGLGYETARRLKELGLHVILSARDPHKGQSAATTLNVDFLLMDVSDQNSIANAGKEYQQRFGSSLDILINNAGIYPDTEESILNSSVELINQALLTNTTGPMLVTQHFLQFLENAGKTNKPETGAKIINLSSKLGQLSTMSDTAPAYSISKTALNALTRQQSAALAKKNISVNSVSPGWVRTDMGGKNADLTIAEGADSIIWLATEAPITLNGQFIRNREQIEW